MSDLPPGVSQARLDKEAGSEVPTCATCGAEMPELDAAYFTTCIECAAAGSAWPCEICGAVNRFPDDDPWICEGCDRLVCQRHVVAVEEAETFLCEECARAARTV